MPVQGGASRFGSDGAVNDAVQKIMWDPNLHDIYLPNGNNFFGLVTDKTSGLGKEPTDDYKFNWGEYDEDIPTISVQDGTTTTITSDTDEYKGIVEGDVLYDPTSGDYLWVTATPTTETITCSKMAATSVTTMTADAYNGHTLILIGRQVGNGRSESDFDSITTFTQVEDAYNYISVFEHFTKLTEQLQAQKWNFSNVTREQHMISVDLKKHLDEIERACWLGKQFKLTTGSGTSMMKGVLNFSGIQADTCALAFTMDDLLDFVGNKVTAKQTKQELECYVNGKMFTAIQKMARNSSAYMMLGSDKKVDRFGFTYRELEIDEVVLKLKKNRALGYMYPDSGVMFTCTPEQFGWYYLRGLDTQTRLNVQNKADSIVLHKHITNGGIAFRNPSQSAMLIAS